MTPTPPASTRPRPSSLPRSTQLLTTLLLTAAALLSACNPPPSPVRMLPKSDPAYASPTPAKPPVHVQPPRLVSWNRFTGARARFLSSDAGLDCSCKMVLGGESCQGDCDGEMADGARAFISISDLPAGSHVTHCSNAAWNAADSTCQITDGRFISLALESDDKGIVWRTSLDGHIYRIESGGNHLVASLSVRTGGYLGETPLPFPTSWKDDKREKRGAFVASLDEDGKLRWVRFLGTLGAEDTRADVVSIPLLAMDRDGDALLGEARPARLRRWDEKGNERWSRKIDGLDALTAMAMTRSGDTIFAAGLSAKTLRIVGLGRDGAPLWRHELSAKPGSVHDLRVAPNGDAWALYNPEPSYLTRQHLWIAQISMDGRIRRNLDLGIYRAGTVAPWRGGAWLALSQEGEIAGDENIAEIRRLRSTGETDSTLPFLESPRARITYYPGGSRPFVIAVPGSDDFIVTRGEAWKEDRWTTLAQRLAPDGSIRWTERLDLREDYLERSEGLAALPSGDVVMALSPHLWQQNRSVILRLRH